MPRSSPSPSPSRGLVLRAGVLGVGLLLGLAAAEVLVRTWAPPPRTQVIRPSAGLELQDWDGVPVWLGTVPERDHSNRDCLDAHPDARVVAATGSSILYGAGVETAQTWSHLLQDRLDADPPPGGKVCVLNLARSAYGFDQKRITLERALAEQDVDVVLWEVWATDVQAYTRLGDVVIRLVDFETGPDGYPNPFSLPLWLNRALFDHAHAYAFAVLSAAHRAERPRDPGGFERVFTVRMPEVEAMVRDEGAALLLLPAPPLHAPFEEAVARDEDFEAAARAWVGDGRDGVALHFLDEALLGRDVEAVRLDECCHYNPTGHVALAEAMEPWVRAALAGDGDDTGEGYGDGDD